MKQLADMSERQAVALASMALQVEADNRAVYGDGWRAKITPCEATFLAIMQELELYEPEAAA